MSRKEIPCAFHFSDQVIKANLVALEQDDTIKVFYESIRTQMLHAFDLEIQSYTWHVHLYYNNKELAFASEVPGQESYAVCPEGNGDFSATLIVVSKVQSTSPKECMLGICCQRSGHNCRARTVNLLWKWSRVLAATGVTTGLIIYCVIAYKSDQIPNVATIKSST